MRCLHCHREGVPVSTEVCPQCGVYLPSLTRDVLPPGTLLHGGAYRVDYALGRGGFGVTYRALHTALDRVLAVKEYYPQEHAVREGSTGRLSVPHPSKEAYGRGLQRFVREGRILAGLHHPNIVRVSDLFEERGTAYLAMDLITGRTLRGEMDAGPGRRMTVNAVVNVASGVVDALGDLHRAGVYHLDIKPDNVLVTPEGRAVLIDFGAARQGLGGCTTQAFTMEYAAPEVLAGTAVGPESDLFELGMMLHEMLTGKRPPSALDRLVRDAWVPAGLGTPWDNLLASALQLRKEDRPASVRTWWEGRHAFGVPRGPAGSTGGAGVRPVEKAVGPGRRAAGAEVPSRRAGSKGKAERPTAPNRRTLTAGAGLASVLVAFTYWGFAGGGHVPGTGAAGPRLGGASPQGGAAPSESSAPAYLQATSNADVATLYYRDEAGREGSADCSPDSELLSLAPGRYRVRIEGPAGRAIAHERTLDLRPGRRVYLGPD